MSYICENQTRKGFDIKAYRKKRREDALHCVRCGIAVSESRKESAEKWYNQEEVARLDPYKDWGGLTKNISGNKGESHG